ncbi:phosphate regulon sensor histidine kinase PhoR [Neisseria animalis]|uniref:histidine kinase n=1 Tax=Neisseria animalis TaxID=492 RepID=A0A5P3MSL2_NEIAN|nr:phosphate regulon sensor histidine kinase PhoR [Neisseria animalis]QEY24592.1 phosphate regulon sensor histidine kinase PhoR [Neisseria animalis]ROW32995.1 phosphate regulon sensor histidine kinase PhoR [Neisseria animalis]VEE07437.1 two-component system sensor kinase [Neisseria animalis]
MNKLTYLIPPALGTLFSATAGYAYAGTIGALAAAVAALVITALLHFRQMCKLLKWLENPEPENIPYAGGIWDEVFTTLLKQSRNRRKQKRKLSSALTRFNRASEALPNGVMILDKEMRIEWQNRLSAEHFNLNRHQDKDSILTNLIRLPEFHDFMAQSANHQIRLSIPQQHPIPRTLLVTRAPFEKNTQILISQDISTLEQYQTSKTHFVANVSHELRTPLTVISGFLETLHDMPDMPESQRTSFLALMQKESSRMQNILDDLLTLSKLESGHQQQDKTRVNLSLLARQISSDTRTLSDGKHHIEDEITPEIYIDGIQTVLYSALSNLAFNAVRYTPENGHIRIRLIREGARHVRFSVTDNGCGIAAEHLPHLTERFYRADTGRSRQSGGTGLGLAIAKHALAVHQTKLEISSEVGRGSEFSVLFTPAE